MAMLNGYIDDSGTGTPPVFVLAGYVSTPEKWAAFSDEWADALNIHPRLDYFKAKEAADCRGQFACWKFADRDNRVRLLCSLIQKYTICAVACVVRFDDYEAVFRQRISKPTDIPYFLTFYGIMSLFIRLQNHAGDDRPTDFVFDEQGKQVGEALKAWKYFIQFAPPAAKKFIGNPPISRDDKLILPLQAADLLAWTVRRNFVDAKLGKTHPMVDVCGLKYLDDVWDRPRLQNMFANIQKIKGEMGGAFPYDFPERKGRPF